MGETVNLNRFRKEQARSAAKTTASENRVKFGQTKADKALEAARREKAGQALDGARLENRDPDKS